MRLRFLISVALVSVAAAFQGCTGGSSSSSELNSSELNVSCDKGAGFCLASCNLGCSKSGCVITEIAPNSPLELVFSQEVDPSSCNAATVSIRTRSGRPPVGKIICSGNKISFEPSVKVSGGATSFGFKAGETYILSLPGGPENRLTLRSTSGDPLGSTITCELNVTKKIIDLDAQPPRVTRVIPKEDCNVGQGAIIVVEFSELIDIGPFQGATSATSPLLYRIRTSRPSSRTGCNVECDPNSTPLVLEGIPRTATKMIDKQTSQGTVLVPVTQVVMKPSIQLPSEVCVEIEITSRVRDLSGKEALPGIYRFTTKASTQTEQTVIESFGNDQQMDKTLSSGSWGGGKALPGALGGNGYHGEFDVTDGKSLGGNVFEWITDGQVISKKNTVSGQDEMVKDGVFRFSSFTLPKGTTMLVSGSKPIRIFVRGEAVLDGTIRSNGGSQGPHNARSVTGQWGAWGGAGGGTGGRGGDAGDDGGHQSKFDGQNGDDVRLLPGHTGNSVGTGGRGSKQYPIGGRLIDVTYCGLSAFFSAQVAAGGGGGGSWGPGGEGRVVVTTNNCPHGPNSPGGKFFGLFPIPSTFPKGFTGLDHFLVGGSGGGGGGSHPFFTAKGSIKSDWRSGAGGCGGGGAIGLRIGGNLKSSSNSLVECLGGSGSSAAAPPPAPSGGGSGGSVVLQVGGSATMGGMINVAGGVGGFTNDTSVFQVHVVGGTGAPGFIRMEVPKDPSAALLGNTNPPAGKDNVGLLKDSDKLVGSQSRWYPTRQVFPPKFMRYELEATIDNKKVVFSDDPTKGILADVGQAVRFWVQGAKVDSNGRPDSSSIKGWRRVVGGTGPGKKLNQDAATGFRFMLIFDRNMATNIEVNKLTVYFKG